MAQKTKIETERITERIFWKILEVFLHEEQENCSQDMQTAPQRVFDIAEIAKESATKLVSSYTEKVQ